MNTNVIRQSPVVFDTAPETVESRNHWQVALSYASEGPGPYLVDLSHCAKWDFQHSEPASLFPGDTEIPSQPGTGSFAGGLLINRLNATQALVWLVDGAAGPPDKMPEIPEMTDVTDASVLLGLVGPNLSRVMEKLCALDLQSPKSQTPCVLQAPVAHVPCILVRFSGSRGEPDALLVCCSRGYAHDMVHALLDAGREFGLRPAGETRWQNWMNQHFEKENT